MEERFEIHDDGAVWGFRSRGGEVLALTRPEAAEAFFQLGRVKCGKFGELSVLPEKFRLHRAEDSTEAELESAGVAKLILRPITFSGNLGMLGKSARCR